MTSPLAGKVACVTGASRGIGFAISEALAEAGASVVMLARTPDVLLAAADRIGGAAHPIVTDVGDAQSVRAAFEELAAKHGHVDVLVNNAGSSPLRRIEELSDEEIATTVGCNLLGAVYATRSAIPLLRAAGGGDIVNISSESSSLPFPFLGLYAATKSALETFARAAQAELKADGVRVSTVVCGMTKTDWSRDWDPADTARFFEAAIAGGYLAAISGGNPQDPRDVADVVRFLLERPANQALDVVRVRAHGSADAERYAREAGYLPGEEA